MDLTDYGVRNKDFLLTNPLTLYKAQLILNKIEPQIKDMRASKTSELLNFIVPEVLKVPFVTAILCGEYHRIKTNSSELFGPFKVTPPRSKTFKQFSFYDSCSNCVPLKVRRANYTLLYSTYDTAVKDPKNSDTALLLASSLRSHKIDGVNLGSDITAAYLIFDNARIPEDVLSYHLFKRGNFGFLYFILIDAVFGTEYFQSIGEVTESIEGMRMFLDPMGLEIICNYLKKQYNQKPKLIESLSKRLNKDWEGVIDDIAMGFSPSKNANIDCVLCNHCIYPSKTSCIGCEYAIPQIYVLKTINGRLEYLIKRIKKTKPNDKMERVKITTKIYQLLTLVLEAKSFYSKYDENYFHAFFDINQIKKELNFLNRANLLQYCEG